MSVICQNFVQNAWKKDLCSNCFKSVGDHEMIESIANDTIQTPNSSENLQLRYVSQASTVYSSISNTTPHTTWKSLISEKNTKNSQPFKLETGFQGRLLTINKASHGTDKKAGKSNSNNGYASDSQSSSCDEPKRITNGHATKTLKNGVTHFKKNSQPINGYSVQNGNNCHRHVDVKINQNGAKVKENGLVIKNSKHQKEYQSSNELSKNLSGEDSDKVQSRLMKSKSEDSLCSPLHSILKKTISSPLNQSRRGSNVGFRDEEPLVIGYGGRDFSPEELEWDMNTSDGENESTSDSLDETEDDKAFSEMTKHNTEFNSDNSNLLKKNTVDKNKGKISDKESVVTTPEPPSQVSSSNDKEQNGLENHKRKEMVNKSTEQCSTANDTIGMNEEEETNNFGDERRYYSSDEDKSDSHYSHKDCELSSEETVRKSDTMNDPKKSDKTSRVGSMGEVTVVEAAKLGNSGEVKNNTVIVNEAVPPSRGTPPPNIHGKVSEENPAMFSDGEEGTSESSGTVPDENNEWQESDGPAGQILQAINTSLTNRHKMNDSEKMEANDNALGKVEEIGKVSTGENGANTTSENTINTCDVPIEKIGSSDDEISENGINVVEPRKSFLHGIVSTKTSKPSAIYGPASDLFVSRSNSSSSSSSDELPKSEISHSINVIVNGKNNPLPMSGNDVTESEKPILEQNHTNEHGNNPAVVFKTKPKIPAKPLKQPPRLVLHKQVSHEYSSPKSASLPCDRRNSDSSISQSGSYYSVGSTTIYSQGPKSISLVDHYAESNIYHEVDNTESKFSESELSEKSVPRESKLAALAMELEQVRNCNGNTKRQAPLPPKIPDPPQEDPPNSIGRTSPIVDAPHGFSSFRGEAMAFSSSSSSASTSSQDTETGYASWNIHGDMEDHRKHSKSKSSFLLTQYSKCKMLAMGYADDSSRSRKKFSLKKLLKIRKENEAPAAFDPNCPNPKAWKYSDHFERPRAKLEIIHPMDLENKSVTVNPGFDSLHSGSMSSFSVSADDLSLRNSVSSDYGSFYSDTMSPVQDLKTDVNYESIQPHSSMPEEAEDMDERNVTGGSSSPTPSRSSSVSQASTLTSGSSKNGGASPQRPPKPPPPPRAHSLLPGNKALNADGTFKFPVLNGNAVSTVEVPLASTKPQAPKRQGKATAPRVDYGIYDNHGGLIPTIEENETETVSKNRISVEGSTYGTILDLRIGPSETESSASIERSPPNSPNALEQKESKESQSTLDFKPESQSINVTVTSTVAAEPGKRLSKTILTRNKHSPVTKAPARPPPIYMKSQISNVVKNPNPWKTLEDSYLVLTTSNRELLVKIMNQVLKKRKNFLAKLQKIQFQWSEFEIDVAQPSSVFAFGEKIAYHATMPRHPEYFITLVITVQQHQHNRMNENNELKYPVFGQFVDYIPKELLDNASDVELESMQATTLVLDRSNISTIECFTENLPHLLTEENEKELCFIILQLIHSLKSLQAQGIESIDSSFQNLILAKSKQDKYNTLVFLYDNCYDENDYMSDSCKISLCQYTLMLLFQMLGIQSVEEFFLVSAAKFSSEMTKKVFETIISLLSEERAVSLSQTKTLLECFLWEVTRIVESLDSDDVDGILQRWIDIKRVNYIKSIIDEESLCDINVQSEYFSQFLMRTSIRNIKEVISYL